MTARLKGRSLGLQCHQISQQVQPVEEGSAHHDYGLQGEKPSALPEWSFCTAPCGLRGTFEYRQDFLTLFESIACVQGTRRFADKHINLPTRELFSCRKFQGIDGFANEITTFIPVDMDKRFEQKRKEFLFTFGCDRVLHPAELPRSQTNQGPGCGRSRKYTSRQRFVHPGVPLIQRGPEDLRKSKNYRITTEQNVIDVAHDASEHLPHKKTLCICTQYFFTLTIDIPSVQDPVQ